MRETHTIPVPRGWSPEQAWHAIKNNDVLPDEDPGYWVNVDEHGRLISETTVDDD